MAKSEKQKLKLLYIIKYLSAESDEEHPVSTKQLIEYLDRMDISVERKTIYSDIRLLVDFGFDIVSIKAGDRSGYYLASRRFELAELKLLADAVLASKFITAKKTRELIGKISTLSSSYDASKLRRQVYVDRIKNDNESIYYSVDEIHRAMFENRQIAFVYHVWGTDRRLHPKKKGGKYIVSPFYLIWKDGYYYLVAFDARDEKTKYYRVDKMKKLEICSGARTGHEITGREDPALMASRVFSMFAGDEENVTLSFTEDMAGVIIDRFGRNIMIRPDEDMPGGIKRFRTHINVDVSPQFYGWISGLSGKVVIEGPPRVRLSYKQYLENMLEKY